MRVLVLNLLTDTIGDCLFLAPMIKALKKKGHKVSMTISPLNYDLMKNNPDLHRLIVLEDLKKIKKSKSLIKLLVYLKMIFSIRKKTKDYDFDLCIITQPNFFLSQIIPSFLGIKKSIGYGYKGAIFSFLLSECVQFENSFDRDNPRHFVEILFDLLKPLGIRYNNENVEYHLEENLKNPVSSKKYVCLHPGAKWDSKKWPKEYFEKLAGEIIKKNYQVVILGTKNEYLLGKHIKGNNPRIINLCGKTSLNVTAKIISESKLCICNDSGIAHISSAVGTKTAVIYGSTSPDHSLPLGKGKVIKIAKSNKTGKVISKKHKKKGQSLMAKIKVQDVLKKIDDDL